MKCCPSCFKDGIAKELVTTLSSPGNGLCDVCGSKTEIFLEITPESELSEQFADLLSVFSAVKDCRESYETLFDAFCGTWNIFDSISRDAFERLLKSMFPANQRIAKLLKSRVALDPSPDPKCNFALNFFGEKDWCEFAQEIKHIHRYHATIVRRDVLRDLFNALELVVTSGGSRWFRARRWNNKSISDLSVNELKEPSEKEAKGGRMSPEGVRCLYISNNIEGAMAEIRASKHDDIAIMEMSPSRDLKILDLSRIDRISPFDETVDCRKLASNLINLNQIKDALVKPMRSTDDAIEYVPTQYIADFARSIGFDGIGYHSVLHERNGLPTYNIASFLGFDEAFICESISMYNVKNIHLDVGRFCTK